MGKPSREKGARGERQLQALLPGSQKTSYAWKPGPDLLWMERTIEVKRRKDAYQSMNTITRILDDVDLYATRIDRRPWYLTMTVDTLLDLLDDAHDRGTAREPLVDE